MPEFDDTNRGVLFKNRDKDAEHPNWEDYGGNINIECPHCGQKSDHWLSAWIKVAKKGKIKGKSFMSLSAKPKTGSGSNQSDDPPPDPPSPPDDYDDDIPF